jgi:hypothetical protein
VQFLWVLQVFYFLGLSLIKMSILSFYLRIMATRTYRTIVWGLIVFSAVIAVVFPFATAFRCWPVTLNWNPKYFGEAIIPASEGHCVANKVDIQWTAAGIHFGTDIIIFLLPIPMIFSKCHALPQRLAWNPCNLFLNELTLILFEMKSFTNLLHTK